MTSDTGSDAKPLAALTGATGFLGRHVVKALHDAGFRVRVLVRQDPVHPLTADVPLEVVPGDLSSDAALERLVRGADVVIHAAGLIKAAGAKAFFAVNEGGSARFGRALAKAAPGARLVVVSSLAAREPRLSPYAASKRAGEEAAVRCAGTGDWVVLRPPALYGPGDRETLALFKAAAGPVVPVLGGPRARMALLHVADCAAAVAALARPGGPRGETYELSDGKPGGYGWSELLDTAAAAVAHRAIRVRVAPPLVKALGEMGSGWAWLMRRPVMLTSGKAREILHTDWSVDPSRTPPPDLWTPARKLREGFAESVAWYRHQGWL